MTVIAFDTSHEMLDISISFTDVSGSDRVITFFEQIGLHHSEHLLPTLNTLLDEAGLSIKDVDLIVANRGPGSFTGLRIGMSTGKGLSCATGIPFVSVPSHDLYAYIHKDTSAPVLIVTDAKKQNFYCTLVKGGVKLSPDMDASLEEIQHLLIPHTTVLVSGPHADLFLDRWTLLYPENAQSQSLQLAQESLLPLTPYMISFGTIKYEETGKDAPATGPIYIRRSEAEINLLQRTNSLL